MSNNRHLLSIDDLREDDIYSILDMASFYSSKKKNYKKDYSHLLAATLFFESSQHTKISFEVSAKRLGIDLLNLYDNLSYIRKGDELQEFIKTIDLLGIDIAIIRHPDINFLNSLKKNITFSIINAGSGKDHQPTQALITLFTIYQEFKKFNDLEVAFCGDSIRSSEVFSTIKLLKKLNIKTLFNSSELIPNECNLEINSLIKSSKAFIFIDPKTGQNEAYEEIKNSNQYDFKYVVDNMSQDSIFLSPGSLNYSSTHDIFLDQKSRIFTEMQNSIFVRMAIFEWISKK